MKTVKEIQAQYSCNAIWEKIFNWVQDTETPLYGYGNGFERIGKAYLYDLLEYYPEYKEEILGLF